MSAGAGGAGAKAAAREAAFAARKHARDAAGEAGAAAGQAALRDFLGPARGRVLAGYLPIRTEADPRPAMAGWDGPVGVPVIAGRARPLVFRAWAPDAALVAGPFGVMVPEAGAEVVPEVLIVPLLAFDAAGYRLGYGGGFYDRTLAALRGAGRPVLAVGFAYAGQEVAAVPREATDAPLDAVVTEAGARVFGR